MECVIDFTIMRHGELAEEIKKRDAEIELEANGRTNANNDCLVRAAVLASFFG